MKHSGKLLVLLIVIVLAAISYVALEVTLENEKSHTDGNYNYSLSTCTSFVTSEGSINAPAGQEYVVATVTMLNVDWYTGISNSASDFELKVEVSGEMKTINADSDTSLYPANSAAVTYMPGEHGQNCYLYLVPEGTDLSGADLVYIGPYMLSFDSTLSL